jgi:DNA-binding response OmpR family regulator
VLLARLRALIRHRGEGGGADPLLRAGDLWLDTSPHRCGRGEQEIALTGP